LKAKFEKKVSADTACSKCFIYSAGKVTNQPTMTVAMVRTASAG
jgi:hypothetical protein